MMMCSRCKKRPAVVFISSMQGTERRNEGLCLRCAKEMGLPQVDEYLKQMGISEEDLRTPTIPCLTRTAIPIRNCSRI